MKQIHKVAVLGGSGRTGKYIIAQLLKKGFSVRLLLRKPEDFHDSTPFIETMKGDAIDEEVIHSLVKDCDAVISTIGQRKDEPLVNSRATINVLKAMADVGLQRYILVAGINVDTPFDMKGMQTKAATEWMKMNYPEIHADRQRTYSVLSASEAKWTLVRVPLIEFTDLTHETVVNLEDCKGSKISAADIAGFVVDQLLDETYVRKAPFISNV